MIEYYKNFTLENLFYIDENGIVQEEEWRDVPNFVKLYQASNLGRIKSLSRRMLRKYKRKSESKEKILKPYITKAGYIAVVLSVNGEKSRLTSHQLVAMAFLGHVPCGYELVVNHKNEIKNDNRVENLEIITHYQNMLYSYRKRAKESGRMMGARFQKQTKKWLSEILINKKKRCIGYFDTELEASQYYEKALVSICDDNDFFEVKRKGVMITINWKIHFA